MPLYPVKNLKTGEQKDIHMPIAQYEEWRKENPDWDKDWSQGVASLRSRSSDWYSSDAIASQGSYEDKNSSLSSSAISNDRNTSNPVTASNQHIKDRYRIK